MRSWLRNLRIEKGYSQAAMASKMGISRQYYSYIEAGDRQNKLSLIVADKLSKILKIPISKILKLEEGVANGAENV